MSFCFQKVQFTQFKLSSREGLVRRVCVMSTRNSGGSFESFPELKMDQNVFGNWNKFSDEFLLALELQKFESDSRTITNCRKKTVALLKAAGRVFYSQLALI